MLGINPNFIHSQTLHVVEVSGFVFTPKNLTITVNDTVRWVNLGGFHNVGADDNSFTNGPPSFDNWVYDNVFTSAGDNPYFCVTHGAQGGIGMSGVVTVMNPVSVSDQNLVINKFELEQNYPNPFNPTTNISYVISVKSKVVLKVFDVLGNEIATLVNEEKAVGSYVVEFNSSELTSGIYFYKLQAGSFVEIKKMVILK